jgi:hypothetical protein
VLWLPPLGPVPLPTGPVFSPEPRLCIPVLLLVTYFSLPCGRFLSKSNASLSEKIPGAGKFRRIVYIITEQTELDHLFLKKKTPRRCFAFAPQRKQRNI